jgi:hypothetical protein
MPALTLGGVTVKATDLRRLSDERGGGGLRRTVNGDLRGRSDWVRRGWSATLLAENAGEYAAILGAANPDVDTTLGGDMIGTAASVRAHVSGDVQYVRDGLGWYWLIPITAREV